MDGKDVWLIDMQGRTINHWEMPCVPGCHGELLPNRNLLYAGKIDNGPLVDFEGAGGILIEMDWNGKIVWQYEDPYLHHTFYRMRNGNTMVLKWVKVPHEVAIKVKSGLPGTEREGVMWSDAFQEITSAGKVVWEWLAYEHLDPEVDIICPICSRAEWTHATSFDVLKNGDILVSFMRTNTVAIIDKKTGDIKWRWGQGEIGHQNDATVLDNGNILVFDNGRHAPGIGLGFSRIVEVNPITNNMVWQYREDPPFYFYSSFLGSVQKLPNENFLICEGTTGRIFEITPRGELAWEFVSPYRYHSSGEWGYHNFVFSAYRYDFRYEGLADQDVRRARAKQGVQEVKKPEIPKAISTQEARMRSRLEDLGY